MMKRALLFLFAWIMTSGLMAQQGQVFDNLSLESSILKTQKKYSVYLPPDYQSSERNYPVLYLLHGGGGNHTTWIQHGNVRYIADECIYPGKALPMVIVMPDASSTVKGWRNDPQEEWRFEDFFIEEFIPFIEKNYRIRPGRAFRYVAGLSGGGNASLTYALHHPELFSACCPLSPGIPFRTPEIAKIEIQQRFPDLLDEEINAYYQKYNILGLIEQIPEQRKNAVRWYIETGDDDHLEQVYEGDCMVHIAMRKAGIPHEFRINDGGHNWLFWRAALPMILEFISFQKI